MGETPMPLEERGRHECRPYGTGRKSDDRLSSDLYADQDVGFVGVDGVAAVAAGEAVGAGEAIEAVVTRVAVEFVVSVGAPDAIVAVAAVNCVAGQIGVGVHG